MTIYISTNLYATHQFEGVFSVLEQAGDDQIGVEIFPRWHEPAFEAVMRENMARLKKVPISFHGPYYLTEHSEVQATPAYQRTMAYFQKTLEYAKELQSKYIVFHHNNCKIAPEKRGQLVAQAAKNLRTLNHLAEGYGIPLVVENAGVIAAGNMLFNEGQFIKVFEKIANPCLLDIGHAHCNGWDLAKVIQQLSPKIVAYHLHNNYGMDDEHNRIHDGNLDLEGFFRAYRKYTPQADLVVEYSQRLVEDIGGIIEDIRVIKRWL